jgi:hypothetical protein
MPLNAMLHPSLHSHSQENLEFYILKRIDLLLSADLETNNEYNLYYAIGESTNGGF